MQKISIAKVLTENADTQFDSTGNALLDLLAQGPDTFLDRKSDNIRESAERFRKLAIAAFDKDREVAMKIARFFRDDTQQGLKEQPLLMIAVFHDELSVDEIMTILKVQHDPSSGGAISETRINLFDTVRILSWHKFFYGKKAKIGAGLLAAFSRIFNKRCYCLQEVLKYKARSLPYGDGNLSVGILEVLGMIKNGTVEELPKDVKEEYEQSL